MNVCFSSVVPVQIAGMDESQEPILVRCVFCCSVHTLEADYLMQQG